MPTPRPYGRGPYGVGPYERYRGTIYDVGAATQLSFSLHAGSYRLILMAARSSIAFSLQSELVRELLVAAASQISFAAQVSGATRIITLHPLTQIELVVWSEALENWTADAPCEPGEWPSAAPCETGGWTASDIGKAGQWAPGAPGEGGWQTWTPGSPGTWKKAA